MIYWGLAAGAALVGSGLWLWQRRRAVPLTPPADAEVLPLNLPADVTITATGAYCVRWPGVNGFTVQTQLLGALEITPPPVTASGDSVELADGLHGYRPIFTLTAPDDRQLRTAERVLPLTSIFNFRDLGGYPTADGKTVKWGVLYRAGQLHSLGHDDTLYLERVGLRLVCDLRTEEEMLSAPDHLPLGARHEHYPLHADQGTLARLRALLFNRRAVATMLPDAYKYILIDRNAGVFGAVLRRLAEADLLPAAFHCTAGKDRTGVVAALLLSVLGVPDAYIIADYTQTNLFYSRIREVARQALKPLAILGVTVEQLHPLLSAAPATIAQTLDYVRERYGSVEAYLREQAGLDDAVFERLRANLLE